MGYVQTPEIENGELQTSVRSGTRSLPNSRAVVSHLTPSPRRVERETQEGGTTALECVGSPRWHEFVEWEKLFNVG